MILIDFGHAFYPVYLSLGGGTKNYSAPELELQNQLFNEKSDIYSFGKILRFITDNLKITIYNNIIIKCIDQNEISRISTIDNLKKEFNSFNFQIKLKTKIFK